MKIIANIFFHFGIFVLGFYLAPLVNFTIKVEWWRMIGIIIIVMISYIYLRGRRFHNIENYNNWKVFRKNK